MGAVKFYVGSTLAGAGLVLAFGFVLVFLWRHPPAADTMRVVLILRGAAAVFAFLLVVLGIATLVESIIGLSGGTVDTP